MSDKQFSIDLNTDELVSYLAEDFGKKVLSYIQNNKINGKSFISLTSDRLKDSNLTAKFQKDLLDKVAEVKSSLSSSTCSKLSEALEPSRPTARKVLHIIFQTILPAQLWGWIGGNVCIQFLELKMNYHPLQILKSEPTASGYILFQGKVSVSIDTIKKCKCCLLYKYLVSSLLLSDQKYHLEDLHYFDDAVSRVLKIPENLLYPESTFRQYDVPIYPRKKIIHEVENRLDAVEQHLKEIFPGTSTYTLEPKFPATDCDMRNISLRLHLDKLKCELLQCSLDLSSSLIKEIYEKIKLVYKQLYDITVQVEIMEYFSVKNHSKSFVADENFRECLSDWIVDLAKQLESKSLSNHQSIIPGAIFCLLLSYFGIVDNLPQGTLKLLMKFLYLKPDEEGNSAYRNLLSCLSNDDLKKELHTSVEKLCCQFIRLIQGKSIDWLKNTPLPLYHFLRGISEPFVPIKMKLEMEWSFWRTIKDNKHSFHKYLLDKDFSFKEIYSSLEDLMKLDPVLMKVVLYLCPEDQLHTIITKAPPFLVTSYLIHIYRDRDKEIKEHEASLLDLCIKNLAISLCQLKEEEWRTNATKLYQISIKLLEMFFKKIQSTGKHHQTVLFAFINYFLYLVSKMHENEEKSDTRSHMEKMQNMLSSWFNHHNVIGGSSFGGTIKQQKVKEELEIWISLYECVKCPECISDLWTHQFKAILEGRTEEVSSNKSKVAVFLEVVKHENCPKGIVDIFIVTALNGLASLKGNEAQDAVASLMKQKKDVAKIGRLLSQFIIKRHNSPTVHTKLTTDELLNWEVWPNFIELSVKGDPVIAEMNGESVALIEEAYIKIIEVESSLKSGSITLHELNQLVKEKEKTQRLLKASSASIDDICSFETVIVKLKEYVDVVSTLFHSLRPCFTGYEKMKEDLLRDRNSLAMNEICPTWATGDHYNFLLSPELGKDSALMQNIDTFYVMIKCEIFRKIWWTYQEKLLDNNLTQQQFVDQVWTPAIDDSLSLIKKCYDGSAIVSAVVIYFPSFDQETIQDNLIELQKALSNCCSRYSARIPSKNAWIRQVSKKISTYQRFRHYQETAAYLLKLKDCLQWTGNFHLLESIAEQNTYISTLNDVNQYVLSTCEKLKVVSTEDKKYCLHYLVESWEIVQWIAQGFTDLPDLQTFIDVAYTSGTIADDDLNIKKLNALRYVGNSVANFIPVLKNNSQSIQQSLGSSGDDQSMKLIQLCNNLWIFLERNKELPSLIKDCTRNLQWFKNIKGTHGAVEVNTLEELRIILAEGEFFVGCEVKEACYQISDVIYLQVDSGGFTKQYDLEQLQDLESRLVLFAGQSAEVSDVQRFLNIFHTICIIADMLIKLHELGCVQYIGWQRNFSFSRSELTSLEKDQRCMYQQLSRWSEAVDAARNQYHVLNSFTMKQLLHLRKELHPVFSDDDISFSVTKQTCALLQCIHPCINPEDMNNILKEAWKQSDCHISDVSETSIINAGDSVNIESEAPDVTVDELEKELSDDQRLVYVELTEINGLDELWSLAEIISRKQNSTAIMTNDILKHFASLEDEDQKPNKDELMKIILSNREAQEEPPSVHKISSDTTKRDSTIADPKHLEMLDLEIHGYLSLTNLMHVLTNYNMNAHRKIELIPRNRHVSAIDFYPGFPNLYVTSSAEILQTVLMIYSKDKEMPLPTQEEVLICNEKTTAEEVILLWRRAIFDPGHKRIFCLVHGEKLSYSTCEESLRELNRLKQGQKSYRLVLLCSNNEDSLHFITALHSYKRSNPDISDAILKDYLLHHLIKPKHTSIGTISSAIQASSVDRHCSYVRIVQSENPGNGKSLYIQRLGERLMNSLNIEIPIIRIPIHGPDVPYNNILNKLSDLTQVDAKIIHFDIASTMLKKVESFLFYVLVLGYLKDLRGNTWRRQISQMYIIEVTLTDPQNCEATYNLLRLFPKAICLSPSNCCYINKSNAYDENTGMDEKKLQSSEYKRVYQFLSRYHSNKNLDSYSFNKCDVMKNPNRFIQVILISVSKLKSWSEFDSFVKFLNLQLQAVENSIFCEALSSGFKSFVIKMMIEMSKEFTASSSSASPLISHPWNESCHPYLFFNKDQTTFTFIGFCISKECHAIDPRNNSIILHNVMSNELRQLLIVQRLDMTENYYNWKKNVLLQKLATVIGLKDYYDPDPSYVITVDNIMKMMAILMRFRSGIPVVIMGETGCGKTRLLKYLCKIASQDDEHENNANSCIVVLKVHGGTTSDDIVKAVKKAENLAEKTHLRRACDSKEFIPVFGTVLFFDEANTSEHINLIKEIMCDGSVLGRKIHQDLRVVAACNPYRKHSEVMIKRLESAGLGFSTKSSQASHMLEQIPLRQLVYRVNELPLSMKSLIFDFGGIQENAEQQYIKQIVEIKIQHSLKMYVDSISDVLSWSQNYMRNKESECSFVSLRDVDRAVTVFIFFHELLNGDLTKEINQKVKNHELIENKVTRALIFTLGVCYHARLESREEFEEKVLFVFKKPIHVKQSNGSVFRDEIKCCQEVFLDNMKLGRNIARNNALRENVFMMVVCISLRIPLFLVGKPGSSKSLAKSVILNSLKGPNSESEFLKSLKEVQLFSYQCSQLSTSESILKLFSQASNVQSTWDKSKYVAVVVLDEVGLAEDSPSLPLKVLHPLLEDGTEGNSYSVDEVIDQEERVGFIGISNWALDPAKMNRGIMIIRGDPSQEELEQSALQICSEEGMDKTIVESLKLYFKSFAEAYQHVLKEQKKMREFFGLRDFYSLVKMLFWMCKAAKQVPNEKQIQHVILRNFSGFPIDAEIDIIGLFNKKLCSSPHPDKNESRKKCRGFLKEEFKETMFNVVSKKLLHDFKSMLAKEQEEQILTSQDVLDHQKIEFSNCYQKGDFKYPEINEKFEKMVEEYCNKRFDNELWPFIINPDNTASGLVVSSLFNKERTVHGESRYLLFLTENYSALQTLQHFLRDSSLKQDKPPYVLFGSSFPKDKDFTQINRNINNIKVCMETGRTVVLLNLDHLYESLYDALNQYYVYFGNMRFVDLGLQNHRVKCHVHDNFKLILIAEKEKVYLEFPTALINRLEKHFVVTSTILTEEQLSIEQKLNEWIQKFCTEGFRSNRKFEPSDSFIGFQSDTPAAVVFKASRMIEKHNLKKQLDKCKFLLLEIATPDALVRLKQSENIDENEFQKIASIYIHEQHHQSLKEFLLYHINKSSNRQGCRMQVTTCNDLLSEEEVVDICKTLNLKGSIDVCILQEFDTEFEFTRKIRESFQNNTSLLIIQCDSGHLNSDLLACAKYRVDDIFTDMNTGAFNSSFEAERQTSCHILFTVLIPRENSKSSFVSFLGGDWICSHIDDFSPECNYCPVSLALSNTPLSLLFHNPDKDSLHCGTIDHCRFLYKNITEAISFLFPNSKFEGRSHDLNNILYRLLMISPSISCNDGLSEVKSSASAFYDETVKCIFEQLKRNEEEHRDWVTKVALQPAELQKGGAFVKVLLRSLDKIVNEILAQIISFTDRNYNLELINPANNSIPLCVKNFWILAFSELVKNHLASSPYKFRNEVYDYHSKFPFSKEIQCGIDAILNFQGQSIDLSSSIPDHLFLTYDLLTNIDVTSFDEMKERYICDLIQIKWCHTYRNDKINKRILDIISNTIIASLALHNSSSSATFFEVLKNVHQVLNQKKMEISNFKEMVFFFPGTLDKLLLKKKLPLNVLAAIAALEVLDDNHQFLRGSPAAAVSKLHQFYQVSSLIDTALYSYELIKSGSEDQNLIVVSRLKWHGLQVLHLFMEHVVKDHIQYFDKLLQFTNRIRRTFVSNPCDFTKKDTIRTLEQYLSQMYKEFTSTHSQEADNFSQNCINFYVTVISDICMKYGPPEDELIDKLIETVFSVSSENETIAQTRELTPFLKQEKFNDSVPVVRSFILQILLDHNYHNVRKHIEKYMARAQNLGTESDGFLNSLKLTYCQLHENSLYGSVISMEIIQDMLAKIESTLSGVDDTSFSLLNIETIACTRFVLTHICEFLISKLEEVLENYELCSSVERMCNRSDINNETAGPKIFLLKVLYRRCGEMGIQRLLCKPSLSWILPVRIFGSHNKSAHLMDYFSLYDSKYCSVRHLLIDIMSNKGDLKQSFDSLKDETSTDPFLFALAIFMEVTLTFSKTNGAAISVNIMQKLRKFARNQPSLHNLQELTIALIDNQFCAQGAVEQLFVQPERTTEDLNFTAVIVHIATGIISRKDCNLLSFFNDIIAEPEQLKNIYVPAMPEDFVEQARRIFRGQFYVCPNGHSYMVTECGSPVVETFCSGCEKMGTKTTIGGLNHKLREDNKIRGEPIQTGYLLGTPISSPAIPERSLSPTACTILKILLHSTLLWTCCSKSHLIKSIHQIMTHDDVPPNSLPNFFWRHLLMNFESLCDALSIGLDDAILLIHIIMVKITMDTREFSVNKLLTSENRQKWEKDFNSAYIQPVLKEMHKNITDSREVIMKDDHSNHPKLLDFVYERNIQNPSMIHHLWKYRPAVTLEYLSQQIDARELTDTYPALSFFLREEVCLRATKYLPAIAELQGSLYSIHHYRSSREELLKLTIRDFLNGAQTEERETLTKLIHELRQAWNLVRGRIQSQKLLPDECISTTFLDDTTLIHLLPRSDCCTTTLVNFLVTIHNQFVNICLRLTREVHSFAKTWRSYRGDRRVDFKNLHKSQLLNFDDKLKAVILRNCHYSLTVGNSQTDVEYNFAALEKQLLNEFVYGKPLIQSDICFAEYRKDVYTGEKFDKIEKKVKPTILLQDDAKNELASKLNSIRHLREALDHLEIVMGFLAAGGEENGNTLIAKYAELLKIKSFNTTIGGHCLGQIQSLWKVVSLNLAIELTITNEAPFDVLPCFHKPIGTEELEALDEKLQQVNLDVVLSALNEFIEVHVRNAQENESNWKIGECIEGYFGVFPENLKQEFEVIEKISMEHIIAVWKKLVTYQRRHKSSTA